MQKNKKRAPLISVVMPAYNAEKYISQAIESILNQSFEDFEFVIIDGCSKDATLKIAKSYAKRDKRITVLSNASNMKLSNTLNKGIKYSHGKYIARMDADDISLKNRLKLQLKFMEKNLDVGILGGSMKIIDGRNKLVGKRMYQNLDKDIRKRIFMFSPFCHPAIMIRKSVLNKSGYYNNDYNPAEDYDLYFRLGLYSRFANLDDYIIKYRLTPNSMTTGGLRNMELKTIEVRKNYFELYGATIIDKFYTFLHLVSLFVPFLTASARIRLFYVVRGIIK